jgi:hypothetical protein
LGYPKVDITIKSQNIMHVPGGRVAILARVDQEDLPADARQTTKGSKAGGTTAHNDGIEVSGGSARYRRSISSHGKRAQCESSETAHDDAK